MDATEELPQPETDEPDPVPQVGYAGGNWVHLITQGWSRTTPTS